MFREGHCEGNAVPALFRPDNTQAAHKQQTRDD